MDTSDKRPKDFQVTHPARTGEHLNPCEHPWVFPWCLSSRCNARMASTPKRQTSFLEKLYLSPRRGKTKKKFWVFEEKN
jgi:hypothetical protein